MLEHEVPEKVHVIIPMAPTLRAAIQLHAEKRGLSMAEFIRRTIAKEIEYDLQRDVLPRGPRRKYVSEEDRKIAVKRRRDSQRELKRLLLAEYRQAQRQKDAEALETSAKQQSITKKEAN